MAHHLVGSGEVVEMLGVSRQRVAQLAASFPDFPEPEVELSAGRIWKREDIEAWITAHPERVPRRADLPTCSFCGKTETAVAKLVHGPETHICNECVDVAVDVLWDEDLSVLPKLAQRVGAGGA